MWDATNDFKNIRTLYGHDHSVSSARFLPGDDFIISASRDKSIKVWEVATGCVSRFFENKPSLLSMVCLDIALKHSLDTPSGFDTWFRRRMVDY